MIEIIHFTNRYSKKFVAVFCPMTRYFCTFESKEYYNRYHAGLEPPAFPVPVCARDNPQFCRLLTIVRWCMHTMFEDCEDT